MVDTFKALHPLLQRVELLIDEYLSSDIPLLDATNRSLREHPGKMMRPCLALLSAGATGVTGDDSYRFAAASEMFHNATLLHDDVVDGASQRRGMPTVASILGGSAAVLLGDFWLVRGMQLIMDSGANTLRVVRLFSKTLSDLAEGEMLQLQKSSQADTTEADYLRIIYCKTASLFEASALAGAISAGASEQGEKAVSEFARNIGLAFQIKDDIFDYAPASESLGKPVGQDLLEQKITMPLLCALDSVEPSEALRVRKAVSSISDNTSLASRVRDFVIGHDGIAAAVKKLDFYIQKAISSLDALPESQEKSYLAKLALYVGERSF